MADNSQYLRVELLPNTSNKNFNFVEILWYFCCRNSVKYVPSKRKSNGFLSGLNAIVQIFKFCLAGSRFLFPHYNKISSAVPVNKLFLF
jgi:hypothetical protein